MNLGLDLALGNTSDELEVALREATPLQVRYAVALFYAEDEYEACRMLDIPESRIRQPGFLNACNVILEIIKRDYVRGVMTILERFALEAAMVKAAGLKSTRETTRQKAATEILNRTVGRPGERGGEGNTVQILYIKEGFNPAEAWDKPIIEGEIID